MQPLRLLLFGLLCCWLAGHVSGVSRSATSTSHLVRRIDDLLKGIASEEENRQLADDDFSGKAQQLLSKYNDPSLIPNPDEVVALLRSSEDGRNSTAAEWTGATYRGLQENRESNAEELAELSEEEMEQGDDSNSSPLSDVSFVEEEGKADLPTLRGMYNAAKRTVKAGVRMAKRAFGRLRRRRRRRKVSHVNPTIDTSQDGNVLLWEISRVCHDVGFLFFSPLCAQFFPFLLDGGRLFVCVASLLFPMF